MDEAPNFYRLQGDNRDLRYDCLITVYRGHMVTNVPCDGNFGGGANTLNSIGCFMLMRIIRGTRICALR